MIWMANKQPIYQSLTQEEIQASYQVMAEDTEYLDEMVENTSFLGVL